MIATEVDDSPDPAEHHFGPGAPGDRNQGLVAMTRKQQLMAALGVLVAILGFLLFGLISTPPGH